MLHQDLFRLANRAVHAARIGRQDQRRAVRGEQAAALFAHGIGHRQDEAIPPHRAHQRETDPRVAAGRLDDRVAGLQAAFALGGFDHVEADAVLDGTAGVHRLDFGPHFGMFGAGHPPQPHDRSRSDELEWGTGDLAGRGHQRQVNGETRAGMISAGL